MELYIGLSKDTEINITLNQIYHFHRLILKFKQDLVSYTKLNAPENSPFSQSLGQKLSRPGKWQSYRSGEEHGGLFKIEHELAFPQVQCEVF